ncbi:MAG: type II toxin-antitoxin system Phd/YefM family antitoxin [Deltaproteobacteria bacterium]|jgi:antitoxin StbD|nr:type II toxin-antitoxin system Phd/YefM family antitoxin [Deltaproteobacteria bacterium]
MNTIYAAKTASVTELKRNFAALLSQAEDDPVAILNHNKPEAYLLSAAHYERLRARLEDLEDMQKVKERAGGPFVEVDIDAL